MNYKRVLTQSVERNLLKDKYNTRSSSGLKSLIQNLNLHIGGNSRDDGVFKKKIEKLNLKFYLETEKFLQHKNDLSSEGEKCQESLFYILFQQISVYIEEVDRLNNYVAQLNTTHINIKDKIDTIKQLQNEKASLKKTNQILKRLNLNMEKKLLTYREHNIKLKRDNESLNRQIKFYKDKIRIDLKMKHKTEKTSLLNKSFFKSIGKQYNTKMCGKSVMNKTFYQHSNNMLNRSFNSHNTHKFSYYSGAPGSKNKIFSKDSRKESKDFGNKNNTEKKSGYYARTITRQTMKSPHESKNSIKNYRNDSGYNARNNSYISHCTEDELLLNMNNSNILNDLDLDLAGNSTYSKNNNNFSLNNDFNYNSRVKQINNMKKNFNEYKKFSKSKSPYGEQRGSSYYDYINNSSQHNKYTFKSRNASKNSKNNENNTYNFGTLNNINNNTTNNMNMNLNMNISLNTGHLNTQENNNKNNPKNNNNITPVKPATSINLKTKLSENNIKEILSKFSSTLDEEIIWIEQQEKELSLLKPDSLDDPNNSKANFYNDCINSSGLKGLSAYTDTYFRSFNKNKSNNNFTSTKPTKPKETTSIIQLNKMNTITTSESFTESSRSKKSIINVPVEKKNIFAFKPKGKK